MIIGNALKTLIDGQAVTTTNGQRTIKFHYGDHSELIKWLHDKNRGNKSKYPLVWYVLAPFKEEDNTGFKNVRSKIIIFELNEKISSLNDTRLKETYTMTIEPTWEVVKGILNATPDYLQVLGAMNNKYIIKDEPNYGVDTDDIRTGQNEFTATTSATNTVITDIVDGRVIELNLRIKTSCVSA